MSNKILEHGGTHQRRIEQNILSDSYVIQDYFPYPEEWAKDAVTGDNYTDDYTIYMALYESILDKSTELVNAAESIEIEDEELREVHEIYKSGVNKRDWAITVAMAALENADYSGVAEANENFADARKDIRDYQAKLSELMDKYNIVLKD